MESFKERVGASAQTKNKLKKPLDRTTAAAIKVTVKNAHTSLDQLAWKLENQLDLDSGLVVKQINIIIKQTKAMEKDLKKILKV